MAEKAATKKKGFFDRTKKYFKECKAELKKVTWPTKEKLMHNSFVIIVFIAIVTVVLSVLDFGFAKLFELMTNIL